MAETIPDPSLTPEAEPLTVAVAAPEKAARALPAGWEIGVPPFGLISMSLLAVGVGCITGIGAWAFRELIGLVHNLFFLQQFSFAYDSSIFTPSNPGGPGSSWCRRWGRSESPLSSPSSRPRRKATAFPR